MKDFSIKFRKLIEGKYFGSFQSIFKGSGIEVTDFRKYVAGDAFRTINWKLSAKHDELFVNEFHRDQEIELDIFLDINYNWKGGLEEENYKIFMQYFADIIVYCRKNMINMKLFYPEYNIKGTANIKHIFINKDLSKAYFFLKEFPKYMKNIQKKYISHSSLFLNKSKQSKKRRAIMIFSDFLDLSEKDLNILKYLNKEHALYLLRIPVDKNYGQNYTKFCIDKSKFLEQNNIKFIDWY